MMSLEEITQKIRASAKKVLNEGKAELVIGYRQGSTPFSVQPFFARTSEDCDQLMWSNFAKMNLANYLPKRPGKVAIIAKGCDARSAIGQVTENQISRDNLYVIGVCCTGMIDEDALKVKEPRSAREVKEEADKITVCGDGWSSEINKSEVLRRNCQTCSYPNPRAADETIGDEVSPSGPDKFADLDELSAKSPAEKMAYYKELVKTCLRCYACRNACPLCYCPVCFVDESRPQWLGKSQDQMDTLTFHILRGFHCAGRCTSCGACEAACPVGIKVREFNRVLEKEVQQDWKYEAGLAWDQKAPLTTYRPDDEADFIK